MNIFLSPFAPENLISRDGFGSPVPRQPAHLYTHAEYGGDVSKYVKNLRSIWKPNKGKVLKKIHADI